MTHRAVLISGRPQIVKRRWNHAQRSFRRYRRQIRVAFETNLRHLRTFQHSGIRRSMSRVAGAASFKSHRAMLERERTALIAMAVQASRLVRPEYLRHHRLHAAVRIVAIDAAHGALGHFMMKRLLELRRDAQVTGLALLIDRFFLAHHQFFMASAVNAVAGGAGNQILGVTALQPSDMRRLIQVASQANPIGGSGSQLPWIPDIGGRCRLCVFRPWTVAGFARPARESPLLVGPVGHVMRRFRESLGDVFMAQRARFRSHVGRRRLGCWRRSWRRSVLPHSPRRQREKQNQVNIAHEPAQPVGCLLASGIPYSSLPAPWYSPGSGMPRPCPYGTRSMPKRPPARG